MLDILLTSGYSAIKSSLLPLAIIALLLDSGMIAIWYIIGILINNNGVKASARGEFNQLIGTAVIIAIVIYSVSIFSMVFYTSLNGTKLMSQSALTTMCSNLESSSQLSIISSSYGSFLESKSSGYPGICNFITSASSSSLTDRIDYPLAAAGVIGANVTNQIGNELQNLFVVDGFIGFLSKFSNVAGIGLGPVSSSVSITPDAGFSMLYDAISPVNTLTSLALEVNTASLLLLLTSIFAWPYFLFGGIILRATPFTRSAGGLFIAIAIGMIFFYPTVFAVEYLTLANPSNYAQLGSYSPTFSQTNQALPISITGTQSVDEANVLMSNSIASTGYTLNFFVLPPLNKVAQADGCWPNFGSLLGGETDLILVSITPVVSQVNLILSLTSGSLTDINNFGIGIGFSQCPTSSAQQLTFDIFDIYGISGIVMYLLPLMNIIISLAGIIGLSGLLGGDTSLAGLGRLI